MHLRLNVLSILHSHYITNNAFIWPHPIIGTPTAGEILNFGRGFHGNHYYILRFSTLCPGVHVEKKIFKDCINFYTFDPKSKAPGGGSIKFRIYVPLPLLMLHRKFGEDWSSSTWEEDEYAWRRGPMAISHLTYSGDLKIKYDIYHHT